MQDAFGIVIFAVVGISAVLAVVSLFFRGRVYDEIGRGGIGDDREIRPAANQSHPPGHVDTVERDAEIRQMLGARLDGIDPAPFALIEVGGREQIADCQDAGERRAHFMRKGGQCGLDHA